MSQWLASSECVQVVDLQDKLAMGVEAYRNIKVEAGETWQGLVRDGKLSSVAVARRSRRQKAVPHRGQRGSVSDLHKAVVAYTGPRNMFSGEDGTDIVAKMSNAADCGCIDILVAADSSSSIDCNPDFQNVSEI